MGLLNEEQRAALAGMTFAEAASGAMTAGGGEQADVTPVSQAAPATTTPPPAEGTQEAGGGSPPAEATTPGGEQTSETKSHIEDLKGKNPDEIQWTAAEKSERLFNRFNHANTLRKEAEAKAASEAEARQRYEAELADLKRRHEELERLFVATGRQTPQPTQQAGGSQEEQDWLDKYLSGSAGKSGSDEPSFADALRGFKGDLDGRLAPLEQTLQELRETQAEAELKAEVAEAVKKYGGVVPEKLLYAAVAADPTVSVNDTAAAYAAHIAEIEEAAIARERKASAPTPAPTTAQTPAQPPRPASTAGGPQSGTTAPPKDLRTVADGAKAARAAFGL